MSPETMAEVLLKDDAIERAAGAIFIQCYPDRDVQGCPEIHAEPLPRSGPSGAHRRHRSTVMNPRWHCPGCGHHHGHERCTAITNSEGGGIRKCGCKGHASNETRITA